MFSHGTRQTREGSSAPGIGLLPTIDWDGRHGKGSRRINASDIMTLGAERAIPNSSLAMAIRCMGDHRISALPVVDRDGNLRGIVSEGVFPQAGAGGAA
ncbi:CBS domain-containing protein [Sphingobium sp. H39-3-25]|uniref:CBS domain-containing protein n=1 Tax=Sphingobium arseniciresistens TaxID=3030834 RepID=UPI0023B8E252|nr:CBS domain-containing protein [Sphingobium arseniciresistens]